MWCGRVVAVDHDRPPSLHLIYFSHLNSLHGFMWLNQFFFSILKVVKLPSRNQQSGHSEHWGLLLLEVGRIWTSASFCTENLRNCGAQMSLLSFVLSFFFSPPCVLFTFPEMEVLFFYCTFWYLLNLMLLYGCILHHGCVYNI